ncbi:MAG: hypothetical protein KJP00_01220 [Bacteroidia bacterium]|nr:hypothetical protein [Bacteroidia bacterium]
MAFLMFLSTSGMTLDMHMCSGQLKRVNLFGQAKTCKEKIEMKAACQKKSGIAESTESPCGSHTGDHHGCCQNDSFQLDVDTDLASGPSSSEDMPKIKYFITAFVSTYLLSQWQSDSIQSEIYQPPLKIPDVQVLFQVFRL